MFETVKTNRTYQSGLISVSNKDIAERLKFLGVTEIDLGIIAGWSNECKGALNAIVDKFYAQVNSINAVVSEIAMASEQQQQAVQQVGTAIEQINQVTQQNAANSEQTASAAQELSGQSEEMLDLVDSFILSND